MFNITIFSGSFPCIGLEQNLLVILGGLEHAIFCQLLINAGFELGLLGWLSIVLWFLVTIVSTLTSVDKDGARPLDEVLLDH